MEHIFEAQFQSSAWQTPDTRWRHVIWTPYEGTIYSWYSRSEDPVVGVRVQEVDLYQEKYKEWLDKRRNRNV